MKSSKCLEPATLPSPGLWLPFALCSRTEEPCPVPASAQLVGVVRGSGWGVQPGPEDGFQLVSGSPQALQKGLRDLLWGQKHSIPPECICLEMSQNSLNSCV